MIDIVCPQCKKRLAIPDEYAGQSGKCNHCAATLVVPSTENHNEQAGHMQGRLMVAGMPAKTLLIAAGVIVVLGVFLLMLRSLSNTGEPVSMPSAATREAVASEPHSFGQQGVTCDRFEAVAELEGDSLSFRLETDLPDTADIMVGVSRSYFEKGNPGTAYSRDYFGRKTKVSACRKGFTCSVADAVFTTSLQEQMDKMSSIGMPFEVASVAEEIEVSFVLPINQSDPAFGQRNANLHGRMVPVSGLKAIRTEKLIRRPLNQAASEMPRAKTASYDTLQIGSSYRISRESPLMPEFEPTDPLGAIARKISLPASSTILIREKRYKRGTPWYRTEAYGLNGTRIGEGWINSVALMGQRLTRVD